MTRRASIVVISLAATGIAVFHQSSGWSQVTPARAAKSIVVPANQEWVDSGVFVSGGQRVCLAALGQWRVSIGAAPWSGPMGYPHACPPACAMPGANHAGLIARVGPNTPVFVGQQFVFYSLWSGNLQFEINDEMGAFGDNRGSVDVLIRVDQPCRFDSDYGKP